MNGAVGSGFRFSAFGVSGFEPLAEVAAVPLGQRPLAEPILERLDGGDLDGQMVHRFAHRHGGAPDGGRGGEVGEGRHGNGAGGGHGFAFCLVTQAEEEVRDGDIHWADFVASTAQRGCLGQVCEFGEAAAEKDRGKNCTDGAAVG